MNGPTGYGTPLARSRLFVAVRFPPSVRRRLAAATEELRALEGVRAVPVEQLHLTLRFIGDADRGLEEPLARAVAAAAAEIPRFDLRLTGAGAFPSLRRARVLWAGVREAPGLSALHRVVEAAVLGVGFRPSRRPFRPHVTVGRVRGADPPGGLADRIAGVRLDTIVPVGRASLMRSKLLPAGARHEEVASCPLARVEAAGNRGGTPAD